MIVQAWNVRPFQVLGGPPWVDSARYNVSAKPETKVQHAEIMRMLQSLLADRFQLTMHRETRELPIYTLVLARKGGELGPGIVEPKEGSCVVAEPNSNIMRPEPGKPFCGVITTSPRFLHAFGFHLTDLAKHLSEIVGRQVIDQTGIIGNFNINLEWTPDESLPDSPISIFTAIQEQLGLKLESRKGPVEVWVIDRAEKPSEN